MGFFGMATFVLIIIMTIRTTIRVYKHLRNKYIRNLVFGLLLGLITYYTHGILNNFLDTDNAASLFWAYTLFIVLIDINHKELDEMVVTKTSQSQG
jgi:predicted membrane protein